MLSFVAMHTNKRKLFTRLLAIVILAVFAMAITPWSAIHHHDNTVAVEKNCTHKIHVKTASDNCLICKAHFEKNYTADFYNYIVHLKIELIKRIFPVISGSFTEVIATCLRGPPIGN